MHLLYLSTEDKPGPKQELDTTCGVMRGTNFRVQESVR